MSVLFGFVTLHALCITNLYTLHTKCQLLVAPPPPHAEAAEAAEQPWPNNTTEHTDASNH